MSLREKSAWISLAVYLLVYGWYFVTLATALAAGRSDGSDFMGMLVGSVIALVMLEITVHIGVIVAAAVRDPSEVTEPRDERERLIELKASRPALYVLSVGVLASIIWLYLDGARFLVINGLFLALVLAEMVKSAAQIVHFRRGA